MSSIANENDPYRAERQPAVPMMPVRDPADWTPSDMAEDKTWRYELTAADISEIRAAITPFDRPNIDVMPLGRSDFPLPRLGAILTAIRRDIVYGRGFCLLRGLPVDELGKRATALAFWAISQHLGDGTFSQNKHGHVLGHVTDLGESKSNPSQRGPYSTESIPFHVDCGDIVGLLCMETSISGGESSLASSVNVHNEMLKHRPDLVRVLAEPYYRDRRDEIPKGMEPWYSLAVFHYHQGYFSASIEPTYIGSAHRFDEVPEMTAVQKEAIALAQKIADEQRFDMGFRRGDMQFVNNHVIFHTRKAFEDHEDPDRKRHLLRVWLKILDGRPLPDAFYERHGQRAEIDRPGGILGPETILNAPLMRT